MKPLKSSHIAFLHRISENYLKYIFSSKENELQNVSINFLKKVNLYEGKSFYFLSGKSPSVADKQIFYAINLAQILTETADFLDKEVWSLSHRYVDFNFNPKDWK